MFRFPQNRNEIFHNLARIVEERGNGIARQRLVESLAYDYARCERVVTNRIPAFFDTDLSAEERLWVKKTVQGRTDEIRGKAGENLRANLDSLELARELTAIRCDVDIEARPDSLSIQPRDNQALRELYTQLDFKRWLEELEVQAE